MRNQPLPTPGAVRPNTLRDQTPPNTFRNVGRPAPAGQGPQRTSTAQGGRAGGARAKGPTGSGAGGGSGSRARGRPGTPLWAFVALLVVAFVVALWLLNGLR